MSKKEEAMKRLQIVAERFKSFAWVCQMYHDRISGIERECGGPLLDYEAEHVAYEPFLKMIESLPEGKDEDGIELILVAMYGCIKGLDMKQIVAEIIDFSQKRERVRKE